MCSPRQRSNRLVFCASVAKKSKRRGKNNKQQEIIWVKYQGMSYHIVKKVVLEIFRLDYIFSTPVTE